MKKQIILVAVFSVIISGFGFADSVQATNNPIPGVDIIVKKNPGGIAIKVKTGADGSYTFTGLAQGTYDLSIPGQPNKSITIGTSGTFSGIAMLGEPIDGVDVKLSSGSLIASSDLGINNVGTLPTSSFYFLKEWGRGITRFFTFGSIAKAQLELTITNEKAAELLAVEKAYDACAANALGGDKQCKPGDKVGTVKNALQNFTNAQERLNTQLSNLTATSTDPKVVDLLKKVDEKTAKQAALLEQLTQTWNSTGAGEQNITDAIDKAQNNTLKTFTVTVTPVNDAPSLKQKAEEQIKLAGVAIDEANSAMGQVSTTRGINVNSGGVDVRGKVVETIDEQSSIFDRWGNMIANANINLESAKTAFADGKYGEAYGQARSAEAMVPILATGQNFPDKRIETTVPTTTPAETKTKLNTNTNQVPVKVLENNSPLPIEQKDVPKPTSTSTESTPKKVETPQSPVIDPMSTSLVPNAKESTSESTGTPQSSGISAGPASNYDRDK